MSVLVFIEFKNKVNKAALEAVSYGSKIGKVSVVTYGDVNPSDLEILGQYGAERILIHKGLSTNNDQQITKLIAAATEQEESDVVVLAQDQTGKSIGPRVAAKLSAGHVSGAIDLPDTSNGFVVKTNVYSGKAFAHIAINTSKKV